LPLLQTLTLNSFLRSLPYFFQDAYEGAGFMCNNCEDVVYEPALSYHCDRCDADVVKAKSFERRAREETAAAATAADADAKKKTKKKSQKNKSEKCDDDDEDDDDGDGDGGGGDRDGEKKTGGDAPLKTTADVAAATVAAATSGLKPDASVVGVVSQLLTQKVAAAAARQLKATLHNAAAYDV
jgi:hypothetical protein